MYKSIKSYSCVFILLFIATSSNSGRTSDANTESRSTDLPGQGLMRWKLVSRKSEAWVSSWLESGGWELWLIADLWRHAGRRNPGHTGCAKNTVLWREERITVMSHFVETKADWLLLGCLEQHWCLSDGRLFTSHHMQLQNKFKEILRFGFSLWRTGNKAKTALIHLNSFNLFSGENV